MSSTVTEIAAETQTLYILLSHYHCSNYNELCSPTSVSEHIPGCQQLCAMKPVTASG